MNRCTYRGDISAIAEETRCTSTGRKCDGYSILPSHSHAIVFSVAQTSTSISRNVTSPMAGDKDLHFLEFYHHVAAPSMSVDNFDQAFWSRSCLQMAQSEESIRHALIAIGYLNRSQTGSLKSARSNLVATTGQETFLTHYNKALRSVADRIASPSYTPEVALVSCFIFVGIEILRGNYDAAMLHYTNGLRIIQSLRITQRKAKSPTLGSDLIETSLLPLFHRLLTTGIMYGVPTDLALSLVSCAPLPHQPFSSLLEAQSSMHELRNQALLFIRHMGDNFRPIVPTPRVKLLDQKALLAALDDWNTSFAPLEKPTDLSTPDILTIHGLKASSVFLTILLTSITDTSQCAIDRHLPLFQSLLSHCEPIIEFSEEERKKASPAAANFTFELVVIPYLNFVATRCRCPVTRRRAVNLMERNLPREGLWDGRQQAVVARRLIEIEEVGREGEGGMVDERGWPREEARVASELLF